MTAPVFRFPATPEGRQLLRDMLRCARLDGMPPGFDFDMIDFDKFAADLPAEIEEGYAVYEEFSREREGGGE